MFKPFSGDIIAMAKANSYYRREVATAQDSQVVVMSIPAGSEVGEEVHDDVDQSLLFVAGTGKAVLNGAESPIAAGTLVMVPRGTSHNFINTGADDLKIVTIYAPPRHEIGTIHKTLEEAEHDEEHY
jgi:mannose-6-phosphate isomerase-like protein (cupin superfamily)